MSAAERSEGERLTIVFCGGCNPHIDRQAVAADLPVDDADIKPGAIVRLSGCARACASGHELVAAGDHPDIVVAGELVDGVPTPATDLALTITRKIKE